MRLPVIVQRRIQRARLAMTDDWFLFLIRLRRGRNRVTLERPELHRKQETR